jgi:predicted RNase H-like HicB family nuclease
MAHWSTVKKQKPVSHNCEPVEIFDQKEKNMATFTAVIHKEGEWFVAECPEVGTVSQGSTMIEALENIKEATELYIEETSFVPAERSYITTFDAVVNV